MCELPALLFHVHRAWLFPTAHSPISAVTFSHLHHSLRLWVSTFTVRNRVEKPPLGKPDNWERNPRFRRFSELSLIALFLGGETRAGTRGMLAGADGEHEDLGADGAQTPTWDEFQCCSQAGSHMKCPQSSPRAGTKHSITQLVCASFPKWGQNDPFCSTQQKGQPARSPAIRSWSCRPTCHHGRSNLS